MLGYYLWLALRAWRRAPWLSVLVVATLAVGQAASIMILTIRHALAADPVPGKSSYLLTVADPNELFSAIGRFTYAQSAQLGANTADAVVMGQGIVSLSSGNNSISLPSVPVRYTDASFFDAFDVPIEQGRVWSAAEGQDGAPVLLLSATAARRLFPGRTPLGQDVRIGETLYRVIGVIGNWNPAPRYYDLGVGAFAAADFAYLPLASIRYAPQDMAVPKACPTSAASDPASALLASQCRWLAVWFQVRNRQGAQSLATKLRSELPAVFSQPEASRLQVMNVKELLAKADIVPDSVRLYTVLGLTFLGLCIVNASGVQLSRVMRQALQIGVRRALGARRRDIVVQHLCETLLLGLSGGLLGMVLTCLGLRFVRRMPAAYLHLAHIDVQMLLTIVAIIVVSSGLTTLMPAWIASRSEPALVIKGAGQ